VASESNNVGILAYHLMGDGVRKRKGIDWLGFETLNIGMFKGKSIELVKNLHKHRLA